MMDIQFNKMDFATKEIPIVESMTSMEFVYLAMLSIILTMKKNAKKQIMDATILMDAVLLAELLSNIIRKKKLASLMDVLIISLEDANFAQLDTI